MGMVVGNKYLHRFGSFYTHRSLGDQIAVLSELGKHGCYPCLFAVFFSGGGGGRGGEEGKKGRGKGHHILVNGHFQCIAPVLKCFTVGVVHTRVKVRASEWARIQLISTNL